METHSNRSQTSVIVEVSQSGLIGFLFEQLVSARSRKSPNLLSYIHVNFGSENLVLNQDNISLLMILYILITCLLDCALRLEGEIRL